MKIIYTVLCLSITVFAPIYLWKDIKAITIKNQNNLLIEKYNLKKDIEAIKKLEEKISISEIEKYDLKHGTTIASNLVSEEPHFAVAQASGLSMAFNIPSHKHGEVILCPGGTCNKNNIKLWLSNKLHEKENSSSLALVPPVKSFLIGLLTIFATSFVASIANQVSNLIFSSAKR